VEDSCERIFLAVADNRKGVVLKISVWTWGVEGKLSAPHLKKKSNTLCSYTESQIWTSGGFLWKDNEISNSSKSAKLLE